jgi:hypothetical protein
MSRMWAYRDGVGRRRAEQLAAVEGEIIDAEARLRARSVRRELLP